MIDCVWILLIFCYKRGMGVVLNDFSFLNSLGNKRKLLMTFSNNYSLHVSNIFSLKE